MKLHYMGKYNMDPSSLPHGEHQPGAVKFREAENSRTLALEANGISLGLLVLFYFLLYLRCGSAAFSGRVDLWMLLALRTAFPHEFLHAICFKEDVYLYTNLRHGMFFVAGPEIMSKRRFILLSLLPNLIFGLLPYGIAMTVPKFFFLGSFGALALSMGAGDYINVFHALTQMPKGAKTYLYQFNSYWYLPAKPSEKSR